jgi:hypothetical protein
MRAVTKSTFVRIASATGCQVNTRLSHLHPCTADSVIIYIPVEAYVHANWIRETPTDLLSTLTV